MCHRGEVLPHLTALDSFFSSNCFPQILWKFGAQRIVCVVLRSHQFLGNTFGPELVVSVSSLQLWFEQFNSLYRRSSCAR